MTIDLNEQRTQNSAAIRTLNELQKKLRRQIDGLMAIECEDEEAADALRFAIDSAERALDNACDAQRRVLRGGCES